ncbi:type II secretion system F family protein [Paucibacter sp. PLA-PC-4]|uniref:type II secretion system F family protein n=1 Tax=Paucibacter sp. PLA-PC-4 TaxID=2993655 RepID=UPI00224B14A5|nr:type II secretion system F family protein [Paucibacter sp. PLA-PC-4]MCX2865123.1 type II secretion system F family protein [Paucibacter sp. PLA-PC-4]
MNASYKYRAQDAAGREVSGQLEARDQAQAARELMRQGLRPLELQTLDESSALPAPAVRGRRSITAADKVVALRELGTLLKAGVALEEALSSLAAGHVGSALGAALSRALTSVRAGQSLHAAVLDSGLVLPDHLLTLVRVGEASGQIASALNDAAEQMEQSLRITQELRNALIYPAVLVSAGTAAVLIIFIGVIPRFAPLLKGSRANVPEFSMWVIETAVAMKANLLVLGLVAAALVMGVVVALSRPGLRQTLMDRLAQAPVLGPWLRDAEVGRWATLMGTMLRNRVPLLEALRLSHGAAGLRDFARLITSAARELEHGRSLYECFRHSSWIPPARLNLIKVGERSGTLDAMLLSLGSMQTEAARQRQKQAMALIEPVAILLIGAVIGVLMVSVMMAITSMNTGAV